MGVGKMLYPLKLKPLFKERPWGGKRLHTFYKLPPNSGPIGEAWVVSDRLGSESLVENGALTGTSLGQILKQHPTELMGTEKTPPRFPLLLKLLDTGSDISIQVHPDDIYAAIHENDNGKTEVWYILYAGPQAQIVYGLKPGVTPSSFSEALISGSVEKVLNQVKVKTGDFCFVPPGLVHALGKDILAAEVQVNSDVTYRIHDYGRLDKNGCTRPLNIRHALNVINYGLTPRKSDLSNPFNCAQFSVELIQIKANPYFHRSAKEVEIILVILGKGQVETDCILSLKAGDALVLPAGLNAATISGKLEFLRCRLGQTSHLQPSIKRSDLT